MFCVGGGWGEGTNQECTIHETNQSPNIQNVWRNCGKLTYNRAQYMRSKIWGLASRGWLILLEETSSEEVELSA